MAGYLGSVPVPQATQHRESFTATEGQTSFATAGYTPQFVDVYLNGSHLSPADFTASNGSDVVLGVAASADDVCDIISYTPFEVASPVFTGSATFNEGSADADFRVESNGNANMLFIEGSSDRIGIGTGVPLHVLDIDASATGAIPTNANMGTSTDNDNYFGFHNTSNSATFSGLSLETRTSGASRWLIANEWKATYLGDLVFRTRSGGSSSAELMRIANSGEVTKPLQPAFQVALNANQTNMPIATTAIKFNTERFDVGSNFTPSTGNGQGGDSNNVIGSFKAPVTGKYQLSFHLYLADVDSASAHYEARLVTSNRTYFVPFDPDFGQDASLWSMVFSNLVDMDVNDTASIHLQINSGTAQADINAVSIFSGFLAC